MTHQGPYRIRPSCSNRVYVPVTGFPDATHSL